MTGFSVEGFVDGRPVRAVYDRSQFLVDDSLMQRANLVVALGDTFEDDAVDEPIRATVAGDPTAVLLTLLRACDHPLTVTLLADF